VRFIGTVLDVTEKKRAGEALKRSEERYRAVIEQSTEGIYLLDTESRRLLETNHAFQKMFGYTAEELEGIEIYDLVAHSRENVDANVGRTLELGRVLIGERSYRRKDGTVVEVEIGASTISYDGQKAICATVRDITARKRAEEALRRSEERFRSLVRYASDIIVILAGDGEILYESPAVERVLGFTVEERVGTNAFDYLHPEDREPVARRFADLAREPGARLSAEYRVRDKAGDWRHFEAVGVNRLEDPIIGGIVVNLRDVTERRRSERALEEIREAERSRIARELHDGVLQDLSYTAQAMEITRLKCEGTDLASDLEEGAGAIRRAARDLREAIYDLRAYRDGTTDLRQLFGSLLDLSRRRMPDCIIAFDLEEGLLEGLSGRGGTELLRIVQEALTNVRRHSGARRVNVALSSEDGTLRAEVSDDGRGFDPGAFPPGVGTLGMRERALGLGGRIEVESEPGAGTTVRFVAPLGNLRR
jgi:PAS domain S-box-containing protein